MLGLSLGKHKIIAILCIVLQRYYRYKPFTCKAQEIHMYTVNRCYRNSNAVMKHKCAAYTIGAKELMPICARICIYGHARIEISACGASLCVANDESWALSLTFPLAA